MGEIVIKISAAKSIKSAKGINLKFDYHRN